MAETEDCLSDLLDEEKEYSGEDVNYSERNVIIPEKIQCDYNDFEKYYSCYHCNEKFFSYRALDAHIKVTPVEELEVALQKNTLRVLQNCNSGDVLAKDQKKPKPVTKKSTTIHRCPICSYCSSRSNQLKSHILIMHTDVRPFKCSMCDYKCINNTKLKLHVMAIHTREKPHQCTLCEYKGTRASHLKRHMTKYHMKSTAFKCTMCDFIGVSAYYLSKHLRQDHKM